MFKQTNSQSSTKQLRKTKLLDSYRQPTTTTIRNKIMLTDLCPEQKAKIGDLVKTLQVRKQQNYLLEERIRQFQKRQKKYIEKIDQMQKNVQEFRIREMKYKQQLTLGKIKQQERQKYIQHLLVQKQQNNKQLLKKRNIALVDQFALTDKILINNQSCQTIQKKKKQKDRQIQTQLTLQTIENTRKYPNNSKSYQKIMKGRVNSHSHSHSQSRQKQKIRKNIKGQQQFQQKPIKKSQIRSQIMIDDDNNQEQQGQRYQDYHNQQEEREEREDQGEDHDEQKQSQHHKDQDDQDDDFNQLAKKWLQLKQKNMSKIKQSYRKSKQKAHNHHNSSQGHDRSIKNISKTVGLPREFDDRNIQQEQEQQVSNYSPHIGNIQLQNNQSFGPRIQREQNRKKSKRDLAQNIDRDRDINVNINTNIDQDFDEIQLNKILKSKNFSASRLLNNNNKNRIDSLQSQRKYKNMNINPSKRQIQQKKSLNNKNSIMRQSRNTPNMKNSIISNSRSHNNIDFYQTDLLDIVSSINKK